MKTKYVTFRNTPVGPIFIGEYDSVDGAVNALMLNLFREIGGGDNENGGEGSLWRCAKEIYDRLAKGEVYSYGDLSWYYETKEVGTEVDHHYLFRFSAVLDNNMTITAKSYEQARDLYEAACVKYAEDIKNMVSHSEMGWHSDCTINDEGDEEVNL